MCCDTLSEALTSQCQLLNTVVLFTLCVARYRMFCSGSLSVLKEELGRAGSPTFKTVVERVKGVVQDAMANADIPFYQVVDAANVARSSAYTPVFQTLFTLANADGEAANTNEESQMGDLATEELSVCSSARNFSAACVLHAFIIGTAHSHRLS